MLIACLDVGSTFTKGTVVDVTTGELVATGAHRTTVDSDVLHGIDALLATFPPVSQVRAASSAGGGLRLAVVGYEQLVTAEAGRLAGLTAGARIVLVSAGPVDVTALAAAHPDLVLLAGGTDGGDTAMLLANAAALAALDLPVVLAGNAAARAEASALLAGRPLVATDNVLPRIGAINPSPARAAVREVFLRHVIGGKNLSTGTRFEQLVRGATPDLVLTGVQVLAQAVGGDVLALDIGGATTDVYSALTLHDAPGAAGALPLIRTVEGDLGMRWTAPGIVDAAIAEKLLDEPGELAAAAARRANDPGYLTDNARAEAAGNGKSADRAHDDHLAGLAAAIALRRHTRTSTPDGRRDLRTVRLVVGAGGVLRHTAHPDAVLRTAFTDVAGGTLLPDRIALAVDTGHLLVTIGLLAEDHRAAADRLAHTLADAATPTTPDSG